VSQKFWKFQSQESDILPPTPQPWCERYFPEFPQFVSIRQTFPLQIFCSSWLLIN